jgi:hypothetical protein
MSGATNASGTLLGPSRRPACGRMYSGLRRSQVPTRLPVTGGCDLRGSHGRCRTGRDEAGPRIGDRPSWPAEFIQAGPTIAVPSPGVAVDCSSDRQSYSVGSVVFDHVTR